MSFESESGTIEIDFDKKSIRGECKKKDLPEQMKKLKQIFGG